METNRLIFGPDGRPYDFTCGDLAVSVAGTLVDADGVTVRDLSGCTLTFKMRVAGDKDTDPLGAVVIAATAAVIDSAAGGTWHYDFTSTNMTAIVAAMGTAKTKEFLGFLVRTETATTHTETHPPLAVGYMLIRFSVQP